MALGGNIGRWAPAIASTHAPQELRRGDYWNSAEGIEGQKVGVSGDDGPGRAIDGQLSSFVRFRHGWS